jgi:hypothetical protein
MVGAAVEPDLAIIGQPHPHRRVLPYPGSPRSYCGRRLGVWRSGQPNVPAPVPRSKCPDLGRVAVSLQGGCRAERDQRLWAGQRQPSAEGARGETPVEHAPGSERRTTVRSVRKNLICRMVAEPTVVFLRDTAMACWCRSAYAARAENLQSCDHPPED